MSEEQQTNFRSGALIFAIAFVVLAVFLITQLGSETKFSSKGKLFAQPAFWPGVSIVGMLLFGTFHFLGEWLKRFAGVAVGETLAKTLAELGIWVRALEYLVWFMAYVQLTPVVGYLPATLLFTTLLAIRSGYRKPRTLVLAAATGAIVVLIFKTLLSVKIPGGQLYEYLPDALRNFMIINF